MKKQKKFSITVEKRKSGLLAFIASVLHIAVFAVIIYKIYGTFDIASTKPPYENVSSTARILFNVCYYTFMGFLWLPGYGLVVQLFW